MRLEHLNYIIEIAKLGSISAGAKKIWLGQTSLSAVVRSVEEELNFKLFVRTAKGVKLTSKGKAAIELMGGILEGYNELCSLAEQPNSANLICNVACYPALCPELGPKLGLLLSEDPHNAILNMKEVLSRKIITAILNGIASIGVATVTNLELNNEKAYAKNNNIKFETLYTDSFVLCVNSNSSLAKRDSVDISELSDIRLSSASFAPQFTGYFPSLNFKAFRQHSVFDNEECIKRMILLSDVATFIPRLALRNDVYVRQGLIKPLELTGFDTDLINFLAYQQKPKLAPIELVAIDTIRDYFSHLETSPESGTTEITQAWDQAVDPSAL